MADGLLVGNTRAVRTTSQKAAAALCLLVALADLAQPLVLDWVPKFYGAIAGGLLYLLAAVTIARGVRPLAFVVVAMPLIPVSVLLLTVAGVPLPVTPDAAMLVVMVGQLGAAATALVWLRGG